MPRHRLRDVLATFAIVIVILMAHQPARADDPMTAPESASVAPMPVAPQVLVMLRSPPAHARIDGVYGGSGYGDSAREQAQRRIGLRIARAHGLAVVSQWPMPALGVDCLVMQLPPGGSLQDSISTLQTHPEVAWAQPRNEFQAQGHVDPLYALQPVAAQWRLDDLHAVATGRGVRIALIDSEVDQAHPDLAEAIEVSRNFVDGQRGMPERHGTAVAGLMSARADNGIGIVGVAPGAKLLALRACREVDQRETRCDTLSLAKALDFAIERRADIINMSLSGPFDRLLARLIDVALSRRLQVVAAVDVRVAGGGFPAGYAGVVAVFDALDVSPLRGPPGAWSAPARDLPTTAPGGGWRMVSGTSFAAGQVSGLLALLAQARADADAASPAADRQAALVRLPGGGIDACASLIQAATTEVRATKVGAIGCRAAPGSGAGIAGR